MITKKPTLLKILYTLVHSSNQIDIVVKKLEDFEITMYRCASWTVKNSEREKLINFKCSDGGQLYVDLNTTRK